MPPQDHSESPHLISFRTLRRAVGVLALTLPVLLVFGSAAFGCTEAFQDSISDYYYSAVGPYFIGTMCAIALFLYAYKGYDYDMIATRIACFSGLGVAFLPTYLPEPLTNCTIITTGSNDTIAMMHFVFAGIFFLTLAYISFFLFTKHGENPTREKLMRNRIYRVCAIVIVVALALAFLDFHFEPAKLAAYKPIFVLETIAVWAFGISWLVKGETLFKDKK